MNGIIKVETKKGEGSRFTLHIPQVQDSHLSKNDPQNKSKAPSSSLQNKNATILYIEDNHANIILMKKIIAAIENISLINSKTAKTGIELARKENPDLILLDINLPDFDGIEAFKRLRSFNETPNTPVIALSPNAMENEIEEALKLGFKDYITKPIQVDLFIQTINAFLKSSE